MSRDWSFRMFHPAYRKDIDGLRALAVLSVVFYHVQETVIPGGFVGVDIFFVISGYLITSILHNDLAQHRFSLLSFYERRIRRIFPMLSCLLLATTIGILVLFAPVDVIEYGKSLLSATLFSSNILFFSQDGYFNAASELKPLLHTWSLAVEEQYYIFFPLLLAWFFKRGWEKHMIWIGLISSFALSVWGVHHYPVASFYLIPTRAWELFVGSLLAIGAIPRLKTSLACEIASFAGVSLLFATFWALNKSMPFPGETAFFPCLGSGLVIWAGLGGQQTLCGRALSFRPVVFIGLISYSLYLWHWPIYVFFRYVTLEPLSLEQAALAVFVSISLACLSWRFVERPFRLHRSKDVSALLSAQKKVIMAGCAAMAFFAFIAGMLMFGLSQARVVRFLYSPRLALLNEMSLQPVSPAKCVGSVEGAMQPDCRIGDPNLPASYAVWGDSYADALIPAIPGIDPARSWYRFVFHSCPSILGVTRVDSREKFIGFGKKCRSFNEEVLDQLERMPEVRTVLLLNAYGSYGRNLGLVPDGADDDSPSALLKGIADQVVYTVYKLRALGKTVIIVGGYYGAGEVGARYILRESMSGESVNPQVSVSDYDLATPFVNALLRKVHDPSVLFVDPRTIFCPHEKETGLCDFVQDHKPLLVDGWHLSLFGAQKIADKIREVLKIQ